MTKRVKPAQIAEELKAEDQFSRRVNELHVALFPEEYDYVYDSKSEAKDRARGENPMNAEYIEKANHRRALVGFAPFEVGRAARNENTHAWVSENLKLGNEGELQDLVTSRAEEEAEVERAKEQARLKLQTPSWLDQRIDEMLAANRFFNETQDRTDPKVIAFRILGELFEVNRTGDNEPDFLRQMRRIVPNRSEAEYQDLLGHAKRDWMEVYGF